MRVEAGMQELVEVTDLEQRHVELEKASATVDLPGSRRRF